MEDLKSLPHTIIDALGALPLEASADVRASVVAEAFEARFKAVSHMGEYRAFLHEVGVPRPVAKKLAPAFKFVAGEPAAIEQQMAALSNVLQTARSVVESLKTLAKDESHGT